MYNIYICIIYIYMYIYIYIYTYSMWNELTDKRYRSYIL